MTWPSLERNLSISRSAESPQNHGDHLLSRLPWQRSLHGRVWTLNFADVSIHRGIQAVNWTIMVD